MHRGVIKFSPRAVIFQRVSLMVIPDLNELLALRGVAQGLSLHAHRPALANLYGGHQSAQRGRGLEFEEVRLYAHGDDVRRIDWRVTARKGKPHTKLFQEERERAVWIVADLHAGLFFGSQRQFKSSALLHTAAILGWAAVLGGDRLGAIISQGMDQVELLRPRIRDRGVLTMLHALVLAQPTQPSIPDRNSLETAVHALQPVLKPGSLVLILSDFAHLSIEAETTISALSLHSDVRLLTFSDPLERHGLTQGIFRAGLPGNITVIDGKAAQHSWQVLWQLHQQRLQNMAERLRLPLIELQTSQSMSEVVPDLLREPIVKGARWAV
jgi:uncharacterized protein (DUF58 family)